MNYQNSTSKAFLFGVIALALFSCTSKPKQIKLVYPNKVNYETFIVANHLGYFTPLENKIKISTVNSGIDAAEAITLGSADIAAMGDGPAVILMSQQREISVVSRYAKGNKIHRLISDTMVQSPQGLIGKKIGIQLGSSTHAAFLGWLETNNLSADEVEVVPMNPKNMPEAMKNKQLDAIAGSEPWALNVEKLCENSVHELANLESKKNHYPHLLVASNSCLNENKEEILKVIDIINKANTFITEQPDSASRIVSHHIGFTPEDAKTCMSRLIWEQGWTKEDSLSIAHTSAFFFSSRKISEKPVLEKYLTILD